MSKRYIDADKYKKDLIHLGFLPSLVTTTLDKQPTADVVEVRHGEWTGMDGDQCSNCGRRLRDLMDGDSYYSSEFEYGGFDALVACPFCGAKMDGERRER